LHDGHTTESATRALYLFLAGKNIS